MNGNAGASGSGRGAAAAAFGTAEEVVRASYGRLLAYLSSRCGDLASAEDALAEALYQALRTWPAQGVPEKPDAWLLRVARNRLIDAARRERVRAAALPELIRAAETAEQALDAEDFPDERLKLLFLCAHPAVEPPARTPLLLQTVLGFDAKRIGSAFLVPPATMGQRLVRAKAKIREARLPFEVPDRAEQPERLGHVLEAIYAAYTQGWEDAAAAQPEFVEEALYLARLLTDLLPDEPEARGLLALMLYCEARRDARRSPEDGAFVPLSEQDPARWSSERIAAAERHLREAARQGRPGRFQLEAAIQSAHVARRTRGYPGWETVARLYELLLATAPTLGAAVGQAAALAEWRGPEAGLDVLDSLDSRAAHGYQSYWAVRAHLLAKLGRTADARAAYDRAIGLTEDDSVRRYLLSRRPAG